MRALPNLARRPFVNRRPVQRTATALWLLGAVLLAANAWLYGRHISGAGRRSHELAEIATATESERRALAEHRERLATIDLAWQNEQVAFLNQRIAERTFSWSRLFDRIAEVMPREVRLERLEPKVARDEVAAAGAPVGGERVSLDLVGAALSGEGLYAFVDAMFAHPAFDRPVLARENRQEEVEFNLAVTYLPAVASAPEPAVTQDAATPAAEAATLPLAEGAPPPPAAEAPGGSEPVAAASGAEEAR